MQTKETLYTSEPTISCDGDANGHPRIYLNFGADKEMDCPYCGRHFVRQESVTNVIAEH